MKVCIYGAGAIGGYLGARLHGGGHDVTLIARGAHLDAIRRNGLTLRTPHDTRSVQIHATDRPAQAEPQEAVFVTVKASGLEPVAASLAPLLTPRTPVVFIGNGLPWWYFLERRDEEVKIAGLSPVADAMLRVVRPENVVGGVMGIPCSVLEPGVVQVQDESAKMGGLVLGAASARSNQQAAELARRLSESGVPARAVDDIRPEVWKKLAANVGSGPLSVLTQAPLNVLFRNPYCCRLRMLVQREIIAIAAAMGCHIEYDVKKSLQAAASVRHLPSMLQDLLAGRPLETGVLLDAPLNLARHKGVPAPILEMLAELTKTRALARSDQPQH
ncbi:ketopantoate reductase family protein [Noviherbaspirillum pedocola]|uniref:2-dehydropantoate 2-reductase n=1 Tax=Noviherbaspirillum pedocola TaxID=2801341 RepID=A0A934T440_9BURK|nr:2-dehydropantoate 2-reductase [Noviherbaspirillum pedocola]MBK4738533.1 2-dehydropantoate 2-reductase [Noviherbaspirillum pedocola]